jgi:hypothetical protein
MIVLLLIFLEHIHPENVLHPHVSFIPFRKFSAFHLCLSSAAIHRRERDREAGPSHTQASLPSPRSKCHVPRTWKPNPFYLKEEPSDFPKIVSWLRDILANIDICVEREIRLADPSIYCPVPQDPFRTVQILRLPPYQQLFPSDDDKIDPQRQLIKYNWLLKVLFPIYVKRLCNESRLDCPGLTTRDWRAALKGSYRRKHPAPPAPSTPLPPVILGRSLPLPQYTPPNHSPPPSPPSTPELFDPLFDEPKDLETYVQSAAIVRRHARHEAPPRDEDRRHEAEPDDWFSTSHSQFFENGSGQLIQENKDGRRFCNYDTTYDIWVDYENNRTIHFLGYLDRDARDKATGERYLIAPFYQRVHHELKALAPTVRCWPIRHTKARRPVSDLLLPLRRATRGGCSTQTTPSPISNPLPQMAPDTAPTPLYPKDPLYGWEDVEEKDGVSVYWDGAELEEGCWDDGSLRRSVAAYLCEITHRVEIRELDCTIRQAQGTVMSWEDTLIRSRAICDCRGTDETFLPRVSAQIPANSPDWQIRKTATNAFATLMIAWPRIPDNVAKFDVSKATEPTFLEWESVVWKFYSQSFFDYFGRYPCLPRTA